MKIRFAQIEPTTRCNYTCGFCAGRHMAQRHLPPAVFSAFIDNVEGLEHIELQGEGEPLLHPEFFALIQIARARFPQVEISMISNGSLFTEKNVERILEHRIKKIFVSVESVDEDRFRQIRGGRLDRVREGVQRLLGARAARGLDRPAVGLAVTALKSTLGELAEQIPRFYRALGLDGGITVQALQAMPQYARWYGAETAAELLDQADSKRLGETLRGSESLRQAMAERGREPGFYERLYSSVDTRFLCPWLAQGAYVTTDGSIVPCCHVKDYERHRLGYIDDDGAQLAARRTAMQRQLAASQVPAACQGCGLARGIAVNSARLRATRQQRPSSM